MFCSSGGCFLLYFFWGKKSHNIFLKVHRNYERNVDLFNVICLTLLLSAMQDLKKWNILNIFIENKILAFFTPCDYIFDLSLLTALLDIHQK